MLADTDAQEALRTCRPLLLGVAGLSAVVDAPGERRLVLLSPVLVPPPPHGPLPPLLDHFLQLAAASAPPGEPPVQLVEREQERAYEQLPAGEALAALLPEGVPAPSSWEEVGHILHLNLREEQRPWGRLIGQVLLDKCAPRIATVVSKLGALRGEFRTFDWELLAGEPRYQARVREGSLSFVFDFSAVYWNSRLGGERARLAQLFGPGDCVWDLSAGVGPIALAACARGATVRAFDLNPEATAALLHNSRSNRLAHAVTVHTGDSGTLARALLGSGECAPPSHVVVNLPEHGPELLASALRRAFPRARWGAAGASPLPLCHVYAFSKAAAPEEELLGRLAAALAVPPSLLSVAWTRVREVAPGKPMLRASFRIPPEAALVD